MHPERSGDVQNFNSFYVGRLTLRKKLLKCEGVLYAQQKKRCRRNI